MNVTTSEIDSQALAATLALRACSADGVDKPEHDSESSRMVGSGESADDEAELVTNDLILSLDTLRLSSLTDEKITGELLLDENLLAKDLSRLVDSRRLLERRNRRTASIRHRQPAADGEGAHEENNNNCYGKRAHGETLLDMQCRFLSLHFSLLCLFAFAKRHYSSFTSFSFSLAKSDPSCTERKVAERGKVIIRDASTRTTTDSFKR